LRLLDIDLVHVDVPRFSILPVIVIGGVTSSGDFVFAIAGFGS